MNQRVDELYSRMSQPERIAQLRSGYMDELFDAEGNLDTVKCKQFIPYGIGHFHSMPVRNWLMPISCESVWL